LKVLVLTLDYFIGKLKTALGKFWVVLQVLFSEKKQDEIPLVFCMTKAKVKMEE
jgi:hypothetical protein